MRPRSLFLLALLVLVPAGSLRAQTTSVGYQVAIESPGGVATGSVPVRVRVSGGVRDAKQAAFHLRTTGGWQEDARIQMTRVDESLFEATWDTAAWENAAYRLEVRVWGDVPPYDPSDPRTFARATTDLTVDNPPPTPQGVQGLSPASMVRLGWSAVDTADRPDFDGYRILARRGTECPPEIASYQVLATIEQVLYVNERVAPGRYCFRVAAVRFSALTGEVLSPLSEPVRIVVDRGAGGGVGLTTGEPPVPPAPPVVGEGTVEVSDGAFAEDLPYDPQTVTEVVGGRDDGFRGSREAGVDPRRTPTLIAIGLVLGVGALLIRRFLAVGALPR